MDYIAYFCRKIIKLEIRFEKEYLSELYYNGKCKDKKHRFQPSIVSRYIRCISYLDAVERPEELYQYRSLNFEALRGDKDGMYSIRVNDQYRIEFTLEHENGDLTITICNIVELSNHYK